MPGLPPLAVAGGIFFLGGLVKFLTKNRTPPPPEKNPKKFEKNT
jgi:hypothetical protein